MDLRSLLEVNCVNLWDQYNSNLEQVVELQTTLINDILPHVQHDLELDNEATDWAKEWLEDRCEWQIWQ